MREQRAAKETLARTQRQDTRLNNLRDTQFEEDFPAEDIAQDQQEIAAAGIEGENVNAAPEVQPFDQAREEPVMQQSRPHGESAIEELRPVAGDVSQMQKQVDDDMEPEDFDDEQNAEEPYIRASQEVHGGTE